MRMKAQLENLLMSAKSVTAFLKTWLFSWWSKQWTFLFIECWKNKYAKECLFLTGFKTPCYFWLFFSQGLRTFNKCESEMFYCSVCRRRFQAMANKCWPICPQRGLQWSLFLLMSSEHRQGWMLAVLTSVHGDAGERLGHRIGGKRREREQRPGESIVHDVRLRL